MNFRILVQNFHKVKNHAISETRGQGCCFQEGNIVPVPVFSSNHNCQTETVRYGRIRSAAVSFALEGI